MRGIAIGKGIASAAAALEDRPSQSEPPKPNGVANQLARIFPCSQLSIDGEVFQAYASVSRHVERIDVTSYGDQHRVFQEGPSYCTLDAHASERAAATRWPQLVSESVDVVCVCGSTKYSGRFMVETVAVLEGAGEGCTSIKMISDGAVAVEMT